MPINKETIRWASADETDPITGLPNKQNPPPELKTSGVKNYQPIARQWINNQFNELYNACVELQSQVDAITGGSSQPTIEVIYPVGTLYTSSVNTNPATLFGVGTWEAVEGFVVGYTSGDPDFGTVLQTGGAKTHGHTDNFTVEGHALTVGELPATNPVTLDSTTSGSASTSAGASNPITGDNSVGSIATDFNVNWAGNDEEHTHGLTGGVQSESNLPPYVVYYQWVRVE